MALEPWSIKISKPFQTDTEDRQARVSDMDAHLRRQAARSLASLVLLPSDRRASICMDHILTYSDRDLPTAGLFSDGNTPPASRNTRNHSLLTCASGSFWRTRVAEAAAASSSSPAAASLSQRASEDSIDGYARCGRARVSVRQLLSAFVLTRALEIAAKTTSRSVDEQPCAFAVTRRRLYVSSAMASRISSIKRLNRTYRLRL